MNDASFDHESIKMLAKESGVTVGNLLALDRNSDPFYVGAPAQLAQAEWFTAVWRRFGFQSGTHLRRIHYRIVSDDNPPPRADGSPYENTVTCWDYLLHGSKFARHLGMVDPAAFVDRRNPNPFLFSVVEGGGGGWTRPEWDVDDVPNWSWDLPSIPTSSLRVRSFDMPEPTVSGYDYGEDDQPYHLELWIEKSTMNDVLVPLCRELRIDLVNGVGFQSITGVVAMLLRIAKLPAGKKTRVFYVADFDPAGDQMPVAVGRQIEFYLDRFAAGRQVKLTSLALTADQVAEYGLPRIPIKESDNRRGRFEDRYGQGAVELDALEALFPGELTRLVREAAEPYRDDELEDRMSEAEDEAEEIVRNAWEEATASQREQLAALSDRAARIAEGYQQRLQELSSELEAELADVRAELDGVGHATRAIAEEMEIELPARPEAELDEPDEGEWLFDSGRDYLEQIEHYKARTGEKKRREVNGRSRKKPPPK